MDCDNSTVCEVLTQHVCPALGVLTATLIYLSPLPAVRQSLRTGSLGAQNPFPYPMICNNTLAWLLYGLLMRNIYLFLSNIQGWLLGLWYTTMTYAVGMASGERRKERWWMIAALLSGQLFILVGATVSFILLAPTPGSTALPPTKVQKDFLGLVACTCLVVFYSSPLATLYTVLKTRNAESFSWSLITTCLLNGAFWTLYGLIEQDLFISVPNGVGTCLTLIQLVCKLAFGTGRAPAGYISTGDRDSTAPITSEEHVF